MSAILSSVCSDGWVVLLHHFDSVTGETPSSCANHFAVLFFSTKTSFNLFKSLLSMINQLNFRAKLFPFFEINEGKTEKLYFWRWNLTFHVQFATWIYDSFTQSFLHTPTVRNSSMKNRRNLRYTTTTFQTSDVGFLGKTYMHTAGRTTGNGEPESLSLGAAKVIILFGTGK